MEDIIKKVHIARPTPVTLLHWNISYNAQPQLIFEELQKYTGSSFMCMLLEVLPETKEELLKLFGSSVNSVYSLDYRQPGKFDGKNRKLGLLFLCSEDIEILSSDVLQRSLFPDRTLRVEVNIDGLKIKVLGLHSITGCAHKTAKSTNFRSFAEAVDELQPDILMMDANEPAKDHYEVSKMEFFESNGSGAKIFFNELEKTGLKDVYTAKYDLADFTEGQPLAVSHLVNGTKPCRYDFIFAKPGKAFVHSVDYDLNGALKASADHAIVRAEVGI